MAKAIVLTDEWVAYPSVRLSKMLNVPVGKLFDYFVDGTFKGNYDYLISIGTLEHPVGFIFYLKKRSASEVTKTSRSKKGFKVKRKVKSVSSKVPSSGLRIKRRR